MKSAGIIKDAPKEMPNIDYILGGYNIFFGNPLNTQAVTDPGFQGQPIFSAKYSGKLTADERYSIPDGINVLICAGKCSMDFGSSFVSGETSYQSSLDIKVTISKSSPL